MNLNEIIAKIELNFPLTMQEEWDCSGLQISKAKDVKSVIVCLDVTSNIVEYAIENNIDLIISHHPLIFRNYYESYDYVRELYQILYAEEIALYSMHTNYDNHPQGMNYSFVKALGYEIISKDGMLVTFQADDNLIEKIKEVTDDAIRVYNEKASYDKVSVLLGAGGNALSELKDVASDTLVSSEFKHHELLYAYENDLTLIDVNHQAELIFIGEVADYLDEILTDVKIITIEEKYELISY